MSTGGTLRECAEDTCFTTFDVPKRDPDRKWCGEHQRAHGIFPAVKPPDTMVPEIVVTATCSECESIFVPIEEAQKCTACQLAGGSMAFVEVTEETKPLWKRLAKKDCLEYAAELAADMETGYYVPAGQEMPWPARRFVVREILRRMGYAVTADKGRPSWWPEGGTQAFRSYVEWKVRERQMIGRITWDKIEPFIEAGTFRGYAEIMRRLSMEPEKIPFRDLAQFVNGGISHIKGRADPLSGAMTDDGATAYDAIGKAIDGVGDETARKQIAALIEGVLTAARDRARKTITVLPAKAS